MKVFSTRIVPEITRNLLQENNIQLDEWSDEELISKEELIHKLSDYDGLFLMTNKIDREILEAGKNSLKGISLLSVGFDNIDVKAATEFGIPASNTPEVLNEATADIAFLLMQMVARKAIFNYNRILSDNWRVDFTDYLGADLSGKTLGIFGLGRIGFVMAQRAKKAFGMEVIYHNRSQNPQAEKDLGATYVSFEELVAKSDVISIHSALTPETKGLFNAEIFSKMKNSAILINTSRGKVIDEAALYEALLTGEIWGAGLDVTDPEPMYPENPLLQMENVAVLPHIGSATVDTRNAMGKLAAENMLLALKGEKMKTPINPEVYG